jgi:hypothetical protein
MLDLVYIGSYLLLFTHTNQFKAGSMTQYSEQNRVELAPMVMMLLDNWGLSNAEKHNILNFPESSRIRAMRQYYNGKALPDDPKVMERVEHLVGIADALRTSYPLNEYMPAFWLNQTNRLFGHRTPLNCMLEDGLNGIVAVRVHLDCAYDWEISDKIL